MAKKTYKKMGGYGGSKKSGLPPYLVGVELEDIYKGKAENYLDFIPYEVSVADNRDGAEQGELWWKREYKLHQNVGPDEKTIVCPSTYGKKCPICEEFWAIRNDPKYSKHSREQLRTITAPYAAKRRTLFNVMDVETGNMFLWDVSRYLFTDHLEKALKKDAEGKSKYQSFHQIDAEDGGHTVNILGLEKEFNSNNYFEYGIVKFVPREMDNGKGKMVPYNIDGESIDMAFDLDTVLIPAPSYAECLEIMGVEPEPEPDMDGIEYETGDDYDDDDDEI